MSDILAGLGWLLGGSTVGILLMSLMFLAKESDQRNDEEEAVGAGRPGAAP